MSSPEHLQLLPCFHFYLAVQYNSETVVAVCKKCKRPAMHTLEEWEEWKQEQRGLDKPRRA